MRNVEYFYVVHEDIKFGEYSFAERRFYLSAAKIERMYAPDFFAKVFDPIYSGSGFEAGLASLSWWDLQIRFPETIPQYLPMSESEAEKLIPKIGDRRILAYVIFKPAGTEGHRSERILHGKDAHLILATYQGDVLWSWPVPKG